MRGGKSSFSGKSYGRVSLGFESCSHNKVRTNYMQDTIPELPGWSFKVVELSSGVYRIIGSDELGRKVDLIGEDPESLIKRFKQDALKLIDRN